MSTTITTSPSTVQQPVMPSGEQSISKQQQQQVLTIGCWNILASDYTRWNTPDGKIETNAQRDRRWSQAVSTLLEHKPDAVCLQEVSRAFLAFAFALDTTGPKAADEATVVPVIRGGLKSTYEFAWCPRVFPMSHKQPGTCKADGCAVLYRSDRFAPPKLLALADATATLAAAATQESTTTTTHTPDTTCALVSGRDIPLQGAAQQQQLQNKDSKDTKTSDATAVTAKAHSSIVYPLNFPTLRTPNDPRCCIAVALVDRHTGVHAATVQSLHLDGEPQATIIRVKQLAEACGCIEAITPAGGAAVLCGDFNDPMPAHKATAVKTNAVGATTADASELLTEELGKHGMHYISAASKEVPDSVTSLFGPIDHMFASDALVPDVPMQILPPPSKRPCKPAGASEASTMAGAACSPFLDPPYLDASWSSDHYLMLQRFRLV